jgi:hypothetical protein
MVALLALLAPAVAFPLLLLGARGVPGCPDLMQPAAWPWQLWLLVSGGVLATAAGLLDWGFHRQGRRRLAPGERRAERCALLLGVPLFACLVAASAAPRPEPWLLPTVAIALAMAAAIAHDETRYHRACGRYETSLHRLLVGGNGVAFGAWLHWAHCREALLA